MALKSTMAFPSVDAFKSAMAGFGEGPWFVPSLELLSPGETLTIDLSINDKVRLELTGEVVDSLQAPGGSFGHQVKLTPQSHESALRLMTALGPPSVIVDEGLSNTYVNPGVAPIPVSDDPDAELETALPVGTLVDGRYRIEGHVATGGMGQVYRATQINLKRVVALKMLRKAFATDPGMWLRFQREAELVSQLESSNVVRVFDFGKTPDGEPFLAMEWVEGPTLESVVTGGPLTPERAVKILLDVCDGLAEAHALGVIHRDLKPANIMLAKRRDGTEVAKILDFGIARLSGAGGQGEGQKLTQIGIVVGTPAYLAPEQATADTLDHRTDIYSLGCVAFELVTGQPPFIADELHKIVRMQVMTPPADPATIRAELAGFPALCLAILRCLEKDREIRFQTVRDFAKALATALVPLPPGERPAPASSAPSPLARPSSLDPFASSKSPVGRSVSADDWKPPSFPTPVPAHADTRHAVDEFFANVGARPRVTTGALPLGALEALRGTVSDEVLGTLQAAREDIFPSTTKALLAYVEIVGGPAGSQVGSVCLGRLAETAARFGAVIDARDGDALVVLVPIVENIPAGRMLRMLLAMREAVVDEGQRQQPPVSVSLRAAVIQSSFETFRQPMSGNEGSHARQLTARLNAGQIICEKGVAALTGEGFELSAMPTMPEAMLVAARRVRHRRPPAAVVGLSTLLETLERRLAGLPQGPGVPALVRGAHGSGRSALAVELATRAHKRGIAVGTCQPVDSLKGQPYGAVTQFLCSVCGVPADLRATRLKPALEALKLKPSLVEAAMLVAGISQLQTGFTAGHVVHAVRSVVQARAGERPVLLIFDELEAMDPLSIETFRELVARPAPRELTIGFSTSELPGERVSGLQVLDVPLLGREDITRLATEFLEGAPGAKLLELLEQRSRGVGGVVLDWLSYLDDRGSLRPTSGVVELVDWPAQLEPDALLRERILSMPLEVQRTIEAGALCGDTFEPQQITTAWPRATPVSLQQAHSARIVRTLAVRRWAFSSTRIHNAVLSCVSPERPHMHLRLANALVEKGKVDPASVDTLTVARHLVAARDGMRAAQLWKHAAETAMARRAHRDAIMALRGVSNSLGLVAATPDLTRARVDALARAAGMALSGQNLQVGRQLVDEGRELAKHLSAPSVELLLSGAKLFRLEGNRTRALEVLAQTETLAIGSVVKGLVDAERAELKEQEGDVAGAIHSWEAALVAADTAKDVARWHGEIDFQARCESRLAVANLQRHDVVNARRLFESSLARWRKLGWAAGEARVLVNLGTTCVQLQELDAAVRHFEAAAAAAARSGDLLFQAKALLMLARALKRMDVQSSTARTVAGEVQRLCQSLGWEQGKQDASALLG
jgi:serine/threonine-protein kinase